MNDKNNIFDRRKFNYNLLIVMMLVIIFLMQLFNQKLLLHNADRLENIESVITQVLIDSNNRLNAVETVVNSKN